MDQVQHSLPYARELDGLRGVAILLVLLFHFWPDIFSFGFAGVDVFFVLSGYLITKIILSRIEQGKFSFYEFYRNRVRRIFPALILVLWSCLLAGWLFLFPDELSQLAKHVQGSAFFFQNMILLGEQGYWDVSAQSKPLLHFWSLSVEEQFYLLWPFVILAISSIGRPSLLVVIFVVLFCISANTGSEAKAFYHAQSRFWELSIGAVAVWFEKKQIVQPILQRPVANGLGCFFFAGH